MTLSRLARIPVLTLALLTLLGGCAADTEGLGLEEQTLTLDSGEVACGFAFTDDLAGKVCDGRTVYTDRTSVNPSQDIHVNAATRAEARAACRRYMLRQGTSAPSCPTCPDGSTGCDVTLRPSQPLPNVTEVSPGRYRCGFPVSLTFDYTCSTCTFAGIPCEEFAEGELEAMASAPAL